MLTDLRVPPYLLVQCRPLYSDDAAGVRVGADQLLHHDGHLSTAVWVSEPPTTRIVAVTDDGQVVLRWRWHHAAGPVWELPGADVLPGMDRDGPAGAARRGLVEAGWAADDWEYVTELGNVTAVVDRTVHVYAATGLRALDARPGEDMSTSHLMAWSDAVAVATGPGLRDAASIAAVLITQHRRGLTDRVVRSQQSTYADGDRRGGTVNPIRCQHGPTHRSGA